MPEGRGPVWGLVLAAGLGSRFSGSGAGSETKLLAPFHGRPLIQHALEGFTAARRAGWIGGVVTVLPAGNEALARAVGPSGTVVVENPMPDRGLSSSLAAGMDWLRNAAPAPAPQAVVIGLGDQPMLEASTIGALVDTWRDRADIVRPVYREAPDVPGHPVLVDRSRWGIVDEVEGDRGLGAVLEVHSEWVVPCPVPGANPDIDTAADLAALEDAT